MIPIVAVVCLLAVAGAEECADTTQCKLTFCDFGSSVECDNSRCTCAYDDNSTATVPAITNGPVLGIDACFSKTDCLGSCGPTVAPTTTTTADPHHHHHHEPHPEPEHHHPEPPKPDEHHHHNQEPAPIPQEMHCVDGACKCIHV